MVPMSKEEEKTLSEGKNYEHTQGAVHQSKLELFFTIERAYTDALEYFANDSNKVCVIVFY